MSNLLATTIERYESMAVATQQIAGPESLGGYNPASASVSVLPPESIARALPDQVPEVSLRRSTHLMLIPFVECSRALSRDRVRKCRKSFRL